MATKTRISATVDQEVTEAGRTAVSEGRADNLSAWINSALHDRVEHDKRMRAMDKFIADYEREHGVITEEEMDAAVRRLDERTVEIGPRDSDSSRSSIRSTAARRRPSSRKPGVVADGSRR